MGHLLDHELKCRNFIHKSKGAFNLVAMKKAILSFGLLAAAILLLYHLSSYWMLTGGYSQQWMIGLLVLASVAMGVFFGRGKATDSTNDGAHLHDFRKLGISEREYEVLQLINKGRSNMEVAEELFIAESTVKTHVSNLLVKLDARRRTEALAKAKQLKII